MKRIPVLLLALFIAGCPKHSISQHPGTTDSLANNVYDVISSAKGYLDKEKSLHPECATSTSNVCTYISQAVGAKDLLIDALSAYCSGPNFLSGGACDPPTGTPAQQQLTGRLEAALGSYQTILADLKKAEGGN